MGMAASQARYLGLAARKTNCEYQGQQINQARTALANQSAELWNQMLGLSVPTVPDQTNYTKTQYSFSDGQNAYEIIDMVPSDEEDGYNYTVKYRYYEDTINGIEVANTNPQVHGTVKTSVTDELVGTGKTSARMILDRTGAGTTDDPFVYTYKLQDSADGTAWNDIATADQATGINFQVVSQKDDEWEALCKNGVVPAGNTSAGKYTIGGKTYYTSATSEAELLASGAFGNLYTNPTETVSDYYVGNSKAIALTKADVQKDPNLAATLLKIAQDNPDTKMAKAIKTAYNGTVSAYPNDTSWNDAISQIYTYTKNGTTYYATKEELEISRKSFQEDNFTEVSAIDKQKSLKQYYTLQQKEEKVETTRALMDDASGTGRFSSVKLKNYNTAFSLNTETATNEEAYNQAMNQYYYDTQVYNKKNADINAKTSIIQQQDRTLELRLKQLDTEHNALQTEMEAVKKVITKNVEDTFKTFNG